MYFTNISSLCYTYFISEGNIVLFTPFVRHVTCYLLKIKLPKVDNSTVAVAELLILLLKLVIIKLL